MGNCKCVKTPLNANKKLTLSDAVEKVDENNFRSVVGNLMYL